MHHLQMCILPVDHVTICTVKGVAHSDKLRVLSPNTALPLTSMCLGFLTRNLIVGFYQIDGINMEPGSVRWPDT